MYENCPLCNKTGKKEEMILIKGKLVGNYVGVTYYYYHLSCIKQKSKQDVEELRRL